MLRNFYVTVFDCVVCAQHNVAALDYLTKEIKMTMLLLLQHPKTPYFSKRPTVGIVEREKSRFLPQNNRTGNCSISPKKPLSSRAQSLVAE
jgi:hypothetical protein